MYIHIFFGLLLLCTGEEGYNDMHDLYPLSSDKNPRICLSMDHGKEVCYERNGSMTENYLDTSIYILLVIVVRVG